MELTPMSLRDAIVQGGAMWKSTYPVISAAAIGILESDGPVLGSPYTTREIQDSILAMTDLPDDAKNRAVIYKALTNNVQPGRSLEDYHSRKSEPDPTRPGRTRSAYRWHLPDARAKVRRLKAEEVRLKLALAAVRKAIKEAEAE